MDVDAVLARRPQLVLVDELAHTNAPGSRHPKRYLDVEELLAAGIDVYTTLNIQHLESLNDVVAQITGVTVRETVPDSVLDEASEIELVDLPPPELLQRLKEGKVYVPEQAAQAIQRVLPHGQPDRPARDGPAPHGRAGRRADAGLHADPRHPRPWPAGERLLVCISSSPLSERLVRTARRLADELKAEWFAVYVETPGRRPPVAGRSRPGSARILRLAEELGAKSVTLPGQNVADTVLDYARQHNITKIIAGKPLRSRWLELLRGSVVDRLIEHSGDIDVYVISGEAESRPLGRSLTVAAAPPVAALLCGAWFWWLRPRCSACPLHRFVSPTNLVMLYLAAVVVAALYLGRGPAVLTSALERPGIRFLLRPATAQLHRLRHRVHLSRSSACSSSAW